MKESENVEKEEFKSFTGSLFQKESCNEFGIVDIGRLM